MKSLWRKTISGLKPAETQAEDVYRAIPLGSEVMLDISRPRNPAFHKKVFALFGLVHANQDFYPSFDATRKALVAAAGYYSVIVLKNGEKMIVADSLSYASKDQTEMGKIWDDLCQVVLRDFLPTVTRQELENEILEITGAQNA